jgi:hypothetical protein
MNYPSRLYEFLRPHHHQQVTLTAKLTSAVIAEVKWPLAVQASQSNMLTTPKALVGSGGRTDVLRAAARPALQVLAHRGRLALRQLKQFWSQDRA